MGFHGAAGYEYDIAENLLTVKDLNVAYNGVPILRNVNFKIDNIIRPNLTQGQVDGLLAPSGMGKSTLFRSIAGLERPTSGEVLINYHDQRDAQGQVVLNPVQVGQVGVVAQNYPLFDHLTVWDNVMISALAKIKDHKQAEAAATDLLTHFGLIEQRNHYPHQISGGQRQRVAIIQQIVCNGKLLLMDEPFSGLDPLVKEDVQTLITKVASQNDTSSVIVTTHDIASAISVCDTIMLMGRDRDIHGAPIPGAYIKHTYNLIDMGLTWHPNVAQLPQFIELQKEILARFKEL